jgi:hypothetical protein
VVTHPTNEPFSTLLLCDIRQSCLAAISNHGGSFPAKALLNEMKITDFVITQPVCLALD